MIVCKKRSGKSIFIFYPWFFIIKQVLRLKNYDRYLIQLVYYGNIVV